MLIKLGCKKWNCSFIFYRCISKRKYLKGEDVIILAFFNHMLTKLKKMLYFFIVNVLLIKFIIMVRVNSEGYVAFSNAEVGVSPRTHKPVATKKSRIEKLVKYLDGFYNYNPEIKRGVVLFGISACSEGYGYRISPHLYTDSVVVCDAVCGQVMSMVAPLEKRLSGIPGIKSSEVRRLLFAQVYWVSETNQATLLFDNYEWFKRQCVSSAFSKLLRLKYGYLIGCKTEDIGLCLVKLKAGSRDLLMWSYEYAEGKRLMCSAVSGAVIDTADTEIFQYSDVDLAKNWNFTVLLTRIKVENCNTLNFL